MTSSRDFDWDEIAEAVVIPEQAATAVYENLKGKIVIRQAGHYGPDEDVWIVIAPEHAKAVADALVRCAAEIMGDVDQVNDEPAPAPRRAPMTAAERKRRQRERDRERHERHDANATERDANNVTLFEQPFGLPLDRDEEVLAG